MAAAEGVPPSVAADHAFRTWWDLAGNRAASPSMARKSNQVLTDADARAKLHLITAPALIVQRADSARFQPERSSA